MSIVISIHRRRIAKHPFPAGRASSIKKTLAGKVVPRPAYAEKHWRYRRTKGRAWLETPL